jgi:transcriptional enhancer factor
MSSMSSAQIVSATAMHSKSAGLSLGLTPPVSYTGAQFWQPGLQPGTSQDVKPFTQSSYPAGKPATAVSAGEVGPLQTAPPPVWEGRAIATHKLRLVEYSAFMESQNRDEAYQRHLFVHIGGSALSYTDPLLEVRHFAF